MSDIYSTKVMHIGIARRNLVEIRIEGGIVAARAMTDMFVIHSILSINGVGKVTRDLGRDQNSSDKREQNNSNSFSEILKQEVEGVRKDALNCRAITYGMDGRIRHFEYLAREYR